MTFTTNTQILLKSYPDGYPIVDNFSIINAPIAELKDGQVLCKTRYLSLDPYMRSQMSGRHISGALTPGDVMKGETVSEVVLSKSPSFRAGDRVRCMGGWQSYSVHQADELTMMCADFPDERFALSILGMPGLTAYAGIIWQAKPVGGEVVVISAATGGVGSVAAQLAKARGCRVIGIAGSQKKCEFAVQSLGYDACINRNTEDVGESLKRLCPKGINVYFDLVGGELLTSVSQHLAVGARVILCGLIDDYSRPQRQPGPPPALWILSRATVYGLVVYDYEHRRQEFIAACLPLIEMGKMSIRHDVSKNLQSAPEAFCRLMKGENHGKVIVQVDIN